MKGVVLIATQLLIICDSFSDALKCLNCNGVLHPKYCSRVKTCSTDEKCGVQTYKVDEGILYNLQCVNKNECGIPYGQYQTTCSSCCDKADLCNVQGCNSTGFPLERGPLCYTCEAFYRQSQCHTFKHCETHEICFNDAVLDFQTDVVYSSGCRSKHTCSAGHAVRAPSLVGRRDLDVGRRDLDTSNITDSKILVLVGDLQRNRRTTQVCSSCCDGDLCNDKCETPAPDTCHDHDNCALLMASFDVCHTPTIAGQFCMKTCGICHSPVSACHDLRLDCLYLVTQTPSICHTKQMASTYGCLGQCGYCPGFSNNTTSRTSTIVTTVTTPVTSASPLTPVHVTSSAIHMGSHVIRGPDWKDGTKDGNGVGIIIGQFSQNGTVHVYWNNTNMYGYYILSNNGRHQIQLYNGSLPLSTTNTAISTTASQLSTFTITSTATSNLQSTTTTESSTPTSNLQYTTTTESSTSTSNLYHTTTTESNTPTSNSRYTTTTPSQRSSPLSTTDVPYTTTTNHATLTPTSGYTTTTHLADTTTSDQMPSTTHDNLSTTSDTLHTSLSTLHFGEHVIRGPDWKDGNKDNNGPGTVLSVVSHNGTIQVQVQWYNTNLTGIYTYGTDGKNEIKPYTGEFPFTSSTSASISTTDKFSSTSDASPSTQIPLHYGDHVIRGPDWSDGNKDGNGPGIVMYSHQTNMIEVFWLITNTTGIYNMGNGGKSEVQLYTGPMPTVKTPSITTTTDSLSSIKTASTLYTDVSTQPMPTSSVSSRLTTAFQSTTVQSTPMPTTRKSSTTTLAKTTTTTQPTTPPPTYGYMLANMLYKGARVQRNIDWKWGSQDGHGMGTVVALPPGIPHGWVMVTWDSGVTNTYRIGAEGAYDVMFVPGTYHPPI